MKREVDTKVDALHTMYMKQKLIQHTVHTYCIIFVQKRKYVNLGKCFLLLQRQTKLDLWLLGRDFRFRLYQRSTYYNSHRPQSKLFILKNLPLKSNLKPMLLFSKGTIFITEIKTIALYAYKFFIDILMTLFSIKQNNK